MLSRSLFALCALAAMLATTATAADADVATHTGGVAVNIAGHSHLADATGLVNKNTVLRSNNIAIAKSNVLARQDDVVALGDGNAEAAMPAAPAPEVAPAMPRDIVETGEKEALVVPGSEGAREMFGGPFGYRHRFFYPYAGGIGYGWRYPMAYWNLYGHGLYGAGCGYGHLFGGFYYC